MESEWLEGPRPWGGGSMRLLWPREHLNGRSCAEPDIEGLSGSVCGLGFGCEQTAMQAN